MAQTYIAADVTGDGYLIPFNKVGLADVLPLRGTIGAKRVIVPKPNVTQFKEAMKQADKWEHLAPGHQLGPIPDVIGAETVFDAFNVMFEKPRRRSNRLLSH